MSAIRTTNDEYTQSWPQTVLADICKRVGLDPSGARLIKFTNNAVFSLTTAPVVVRIPGSSPVGDRVEKIVAVARWLADNDMPSVRLIDEITQPVICGGHKVTLWHLVPSAECAPNGRDLGRILRRFHSLPSPPFELPAWRPVAGIRQRIESEDLLSLDDHTFLERKCDELEAALEKVTYLLPPGPIHGDSFMGNLIPAADGPVICDFDSTAFGPREWDLTPVAVGKLRFSYATDVHTELAEAYATDILSWQGFGTMRQLRELQLVTSVLPVLRSNPALIDQWRHRFRTFREGDLDATWTTYT
jgi:thiamine kinase-like enzyme